ncbi:MAG: sigma-70 family RNA polymerase sigma factor [Myxococcota bacterium]
MEAPAKPMTAVAGPMPTTRPALSLEVVFKTHLDDVYRIVGRLLGPGASSADIEDTSQLVFMAIQRALPSFRGESKLSTWIYGVASRVVMTQLRSWRRHRRLLEAVSLAADGVHRRTPEASAETRQELLQVWACLMRISPKKRVVYLMHEVEGLSGQEIAVALGIPVATVWTRLHHAKKELLKALERRSVREPTP